MTREQLMQQEVKHAVKEYVDQLICERRGPGKGMAVSAADLMAASRYAAQKKPAEINISNFAVTGMQMIAATPRGTSPNVRLHGSKITTSPLKKSSKKTNPPAKTKTERHWLTWRTTPTPTPQPSTPAPPTPKPATPAPPDVVRPASARPISARPKSAHPPSARHKAITPAPPRCPTPAVSVISDIELAPYLVQTPEPPLENITENKPMYAASEIHLNNSRPITPAASARQATPADLNRQYRDVLYSAPDMPVYQQSNYIADRNQNQAYEPALKAWVNSANDYERDVAYSLFQALGGKAPDAHRKPIRPRPKSAMAKSYQPKRRDPPAGVKTTMSAWEAYHGQNLALTGQSAFNVGGKGTGPNQRKIFPPTEYTCESSFFVNSMRPFKPHFTINPEWSSEVKSSRNPYQQNALTARPNFKY